MLDDSIVLISENIVENENGYNTVGSTERTSVFAEVQGTTRNEFYAAMQSGVKVTATFKIATDDYDKQNKVEYKDTVFDVLRSYPVDMVYTRLICAEVI